MSKLTEIMKQIPLDELTGDVDMKERNNITMTKGGPAAVKRTGSIVAAAACAVIVLGGAAFLAHQIRNSTDKIPMAAQDISSSYAASLDDPEYKANYEYYKLIYGAEGLDRYELLLDIEENDNVLGTIDGKTIRVIGTRNMGRCLRVDLGIEYEGEKLIDDAGKILTCRSLTLTPIDSNTGEDMNYVKSGTIVSTFDEGNGKAVVSLSFSGFDTKYRTAHGECRLDIGGMNFIGGSEENAKDFSATVLCPQHEPDIEVATTVKTRIESPDAASLPYCDLALEQIRYSDFGTELTLSGTTDVSELRLLTATDKIYVARQINYFNYEIASMNSVSRYYANPLLAAKTKEDLVIPLCSAEAARNGIYIDASVSEGCDSEKAGEIIVTCDTFDCPIDRFNIAGFLYGDEQIFVGNGLDGDESSQVQDDQSSTDSIEDSTPDESVPDESVPDESVPDENVPEKIASGMSFADNEAGSFWPTQYKGEFKTVNYEILKAELGSDGIVNIDLRFTSPEVMYSDAGEADQFDAQSAAFLMPYVTVYEHVGEVPFLGLTVSTGEVVGLDTVYMTQNGENNVMHISTDISAVLAGLEGTPEYLRVGMQPVKLS